MVVVSTALPRLRLHLGASLSDLEWTIKAYNVAFAWPTRHLTLEVTVNLRMVSGGSVLVIPARYYSRTWARREEQAMSLSAVPDDGEMRVAGTGMWQAGRQLRAESGVPVVWVSDRAVGSGLIWADVAAESAESGLQPFLLSGMDGGTARPWDTGEQVSEPEDTGAIDSMDAAQVLDGWWWGPSEEELAEDEELREMFAPFGERFPGLAPALEEELDPELVRRAVMQYTRRARIGLVPAARPADILPRMGWAGACNQPHGVGARGGAAVVGGQVRSAAARGGLRRHPAARQQGRRKPWKRRSGSPLSIPRSATRPTGACAGGPRDRGRHCGQPVLGLLVGLMPRSAGPARRPWRSPAHAPATP